MKTEKERKQVNYYYNKEGIGDTLLFDFLKGRTKEVEYKRHGDAVVVTDEKGNILGGHLFNASKYALIEGKGKIRADENLINSLTGIFNNEGMTVTFETSTEPDFIVGFVKEKEAHPDADKLSVCQVDVGKETLQIVCGAPNVEAGQRVVVALIGALMPSGLVIKESELRGVRSQGMICSARELGLPNAPAKKGILVLDETHQVGTAFFK